MSLENLNDPVSKKAPLIELGYDLTVEAHDLLEELQEMAELDHHRLDFPMERFQDIMAELMGTKRPLYTRSML